jgi:fluoroacetyl-CoA thioesterase
MTLPDRPFWKLEVSQAPVTLVHMPEPTLQPGLTHEFTYTVPADKTVPHLYPEATDFTVMPEVFATGFMVGLIEWTCIQLVNQHLDWPAEMTLGIHIDVSHEAATPPGMAITTRVELTKVDGRLLEFAIEAHDGVDTISRGTHRRAIVDAGKFKARAAAKASGATS